jgi:hypothetical protein
VLQQRAFSQITVGPSLDPEVSNSVLPRLAGATLQAPAPSRIAKIVANPRDVNTIDGSRKGNYGLVQFFLPVCPETVSGFQSMRVALFLLQSSP